MKPANTGKAVIPGGEEKKLCKDNATVVLKPKYVGDISCVNQTGSRMSACIVLSTILGVGVLILCRVERVVIEYRVIISSEEKGEASPLENKQGHIQ